TTDWSTTMPRVMETTVYTFDELSDKAKEKARDWYRDGQLDYDWWDSVYEMAQTAGWILGIEMDHKTKNVPAIYFSGFSSQGDGACFEGTYKYKAGWRKALKAEFGGESLPALLDIGFSLQATQKRAFYKL